MTEGEKILHLLSPVVKLFKTSSPSQSPIPCFEVPATLRLLRSGNICLGGGSRPSLVLAGGPANCPQHSAGPFDFAELLAMA